MPRPPRELSEEEVTPVVQASPAAPPPQKPSQKHWTWYFTPAGLKNEATFRLNQLKKFNEQTPYAGRVGTMPLYFDNRPGMNGALRTQNASGSQILHGGAVQMPTNAALAGVNLVQRVVNGNKPADPASSPVGRMVTDLNRTLAKGLGAKLPEEMSPDDKGFFTDLPASITAGAAVTPIAGAIVGPTAFSYVNNPLAAQALRWTAGIGTESMLATLIDDNTGGNLASLMSPDSPLAVGPEDDRFSASLKSLLPNAGAEIGLGGVFLGLSKVPSIARNLRQHRAVDEVVQARQATVNAGVQEEVSPGEYRFTQGAQEAPAAQPQTVAEAKAQLVGEEPAPKPIPSQPMEPGGPVLEGKLPEADAAVDPWYDPALPEVDVAAMGVSRLDDARLQQLAEAQGPVMPEIERQLAEQTEGFELEEGLEGRLLSAPSESLQEPLVPFADQLASGTIPHSTLMSLAHPSNSKVLHDRVAELTGRSFEEFTRADVIAGAESLRKEGLTFMPSRLQEGQVLMEVGQIAVDPQRFQFKQGVDSQGVQVGNSLEGVSKWDSTAEGRIQVWEDPADGRYYVVNGHNRLAKAKELGIPTLPVEELIAKTPEQARAIGAAANIKSNSGTPFDAAKFISESGIQDVAGLEAAGMPLRSDTASKGFALSRLPDELFQEAIDGRLPTNQAVALGESGLDPDQMRWVMGKTRGRDMGERAFKEFVQLVASAPQAISDQMGLFGPETINLSFEKAGLAAKVRSQLISNKNLLNRVAKKRNAAVLQDKAGTTVDQAQAASAAEVSQALLADFDATKYAEGTPLSQMLNEGASEVANGQNATAIANDILRKLEAAAGEAPLPIAPRVEPPVEAPTEAAPLTAADRAALQGRVIQQAVANGEVRPSATPIPELPPRPIANMAEAEADLMANGVKPGSPAAQAIVDEIRLGTTYKEIDQRRQLAIDQANREAMGYEDMPFQEKVNNGLFDGWQAAEKPAPTFSFPADLAKSKPRYGMATVAFESDLDRAAYILRSGAKKSKAEDRLIAALQQQGYDIDEIRRHGVKVNDALKQAMRDRTGSARAPQEAMELSVAPQQFSGSLRSDALDSAGINPVRQKLERAVLSLGNAGGMVEPAYRADVEQALTRIIQEVAGEHAEVKFTDLYKRGETAREWGGGTGVTEGKYHLVNDVITVMGLTEGRIDRLMETGFHESFHRIQMGFMRPGEMRAMETAFGRGRISGLSGISRGVGVASIERQAVAFQNYAMLRATGVNDPVGAVFRERFIDMLDAEMPRKSGESWRNTLTEQISTKILSGFERVLEFFERVRNLAKGNGFTSAEDFFRKTYEGEIARRREFDSALELITPDQAERMAFIDRWMRDGGGKKVKVEIESKVAGLNAQIADLKAQALAGGC